MRKFGTVLILILCTAIRVYGQKSDLENDTQELTHIMIDGPNSNTLTAENSPLFIFRMGNMAFEVEEEDSLILTQIEPRWIESIKVVKGQDAIEQYGTKAKNGAVSIELKKDSFEILPLTVKRKLNSDY